MIRACEMNMCNGDYVFLMPGITVAATFDETRMWHNDDERDGAAQHAFKHLLYVRVYAKSIENIIWAQNYNASLKLSKA